MHPCRCSSTEWSRGRHLANLCLVPGDEVSAVELQGKHCSSQPLHDRCNAHGGSGIAHAPAQQLQPSWRGQKRMHTPWRFQPGSTPCCHCPAASSAATALLPHLPATALLPHLPALLPHLLPLPWPALPCCLICCLICLAATALLPYLPVPAAQLPGTMAASFCACTACLQACTQHTHLATQGWAVSAPCTPAAPRSALHTQAALHGSCMAAPRVHPPTLQVPYVSPMTWPHPCALTT